MYICPVFICSHRQAQLGALARRRHALFYAVLRHLVGLLSTLALSSRDRTNWVAADANFTRPLKAGA